jgi:metallo-beta-lactamase family protein
MKIKFCGAAREVTGSSHLITLRDGFQILLDCGLYQGGEDDEGELFEGFNQRFLFNPHDVDCLIISHSHIDHIGRVPGLVANGFSGKIYATHATRDLAAIMLLDSARIQESDAEYRNRKKVGRTVPVKPLYTVADANQSMQYFISYNYEQWFQVHPDVRVLFRDAGHILGSATVTLEIREGDRLIRFGFTGDIGRPDRPILGDPLPMPEVDYLICESTYGDREHESAPNELEHFERIVQKTCVEKKGKLLIPAFAIGRTQEIVYMLDQLQRAGRLPSIPTYIDSPLAFNATNIFASHPECFDADLHRYMLEDEDPFGFNNLFYIRAVEASKQLNQMHSPAIIIAAAGMMNAGRIRHHVLNNIEDWRTTILIVGYASPGTPAGQLRAGVKHLHLLGQNKQVLADVEIMDSFSAHGDQSEMYDFVKNQTNSLQKMWLVHGTLDRQELWRDFLHGKGFRSVEIPELGHEEEI